MSRTLVRGIGYAVLLAALVAAPYVIPEEKVTDTQLAYVATFAIALLGLAILTGFTGQISLGHGGFMAIGAYTTALLATHTGIPDLLTLPVAGVVAGLAGFLFGFPALRLAGVYLALATFALAVIVPSVATRFEFTGGSAGLLLDLPTSPIARLTPEQWLYFVTLAVAVLGYVAARLFVSGRNGRALAAIRDGEIAAVSSGVSLARYKTLAFGVSALYAGVAGGLYGILNFIVTPGTFPITLSILLLAGLVIGGAHSLLGTIVGAAFAVFMPLYAADILAPVINAAQAVGFPVDDVDPTTPGVPSVVYGVVLLLVLFAMPTGAAGLVRRLGVFARTTYSRTGLSREAPVPSSRREA